ncbi:MAG: polyphenol oxidase family protein, partial [Terriglobia bacterium]
APAWGESFRLVTLRQRHSDIVQVVDGRWRGVRREPDGAVKLTGDALITTEPGLLLAVQVADCLPILLVDPVRRVVAAVHAGWRGTLARIVEKTVGRMQMRFGSEPRRLVAAIGPGIHGCCYEVGREVYERYVAQFAEGEALFRCVEPAPSDPEPSGHWHPKVIGRPLKPLAAKAAVAPACPESRKPARAGIRDRGASRRWSSTGGSTGAATRWFLDLVEANRRQLRSAGLRAGNITAVGLCTACRTDLFFSHRAEAGRTGRQMALIGIGWRT